MARSTVFEVSLKGLVCLLPLLDLAEPIQVNR